MAVLKGGLFLMARGLGSLLSSAGVAKTEPYCSACNQWCLGERAGRKSGKEALSTPWFCKASWISSRAEKDLGSGKTKERESRLWL